LSRANSFVNGHSRYSLFDQLSNLLLAHLGHRFQFGTEAL